MKAKTSLVDIFFSRLINIHFLISKLSGSGKVFSNHLLALSLTSCFFVLSYSEVKSQNTPPVFTSTPVTEVDEDRPYRYDITTDDLESGDNVEVTSQTIPSWLTLSPCEVSTFAGNGSDGANDGNGQLADFNSPFGVDTDREGNVYVADFSNHKIRKITPQGEVSTFAGSGTAGSANGQGIAASFNSPYDVAVDTSGNVYVADFVNQLIRKISPNGMVSTWAGNGTNGAIDGLGTAASFNYPAGIAIDRSGNLFIADQNNYKIRKIDPSGQVSTFAGNGTRGTTDGPGITPNPPFYPNTATFSDPRGIATDTSGNVYVQSLHSIRHITPSGFVTTIAGGSVAGSSDGQGTAARFNNPRGVVVDSSGNIYVADMGNHKIRKISPTGLVSALAGSGSSGSDDDFGSAASFNNPIGLALDPNGDILVADRSNHKIRKVKVQPVLHGDPFGSVGTHPVTLNVSDGDDGSVNQSFSITVNDGAPILVNTSPVSGALNVFKDTTFSMLFDEEIQTGEGNIYLIHETDSTVAETLSVNSQITFTGDSIVFKGSNLQENVVYSVIVPDSAILNVAGNKFAGILDKTTWTFTTGDLPPVINSTYPSNNQLDVSVDTSLYIIFNELMTPEMGEIYLIQTSDSSVVQTFSNAPNVTFNQDTVVLKFEELDEKTSYSIIIPDTAFTDQTDNYFKGIANKTGWSFTTGDFTAPQGYTVAIDQLYANQQNVSNISFALNDVELGANYFYTLTDETDTLSGSGMVFTNPQTINNLNVITLADTILTLNVYLVDSVGNQGAIVIDQLSKDTYSPGTFAGPSLYGMTNVGGINNKGTIYRYDLLHGEYIKLHDFNGGDGDKPRASLTLGSDGKLYGLTQRGGTHACGVLFSFDLVTNTFTKHFDFDNNSGHTPNGSLTLASDGKFYGTLSTGVLVADRYNSGAIFSFDPTTNEVSRVHNFGDGNSQNGFMSHGSLIEGDDGKLWGMTQQSGADESGNSYGVIFSYDPGSGTYQRENGFNNTDGASPRGSLTMGKGGIFYGMTQRGGSSNSGVLFSYDPSVNILTRLVDFSQANGSVPYGKVTFGTDGKLYGLTVGGGANGIGVMFSYDTTSTVYTRIKDFNNTDGRAPFGGLNLANDGETFYGVTKRGGVEAHGVLFSYNSKNQDYTLLHEFVTADGYFPLKDNLLLQNPSQSQLAFDPKYFPENGSIEVGLSTHLSIKYQENVTKGTGSIDIYQAQGNTLVESIDISSASISLLGDSLSVTPSALTAATKYYILVDDGALVDEAGNPSAGISELDSWSFVTLDEEPPVFTSPSSVFVPEKTLAVQVVTAIDANAITFEFGDGDDAQLFNLNETSGVLTFIKAPDFENPEDDDTNNEYGIEVIAWDAAGNGTSHEIIVTVTNIDAITSPESVSIAENTTIVHTVTVTTTGDNPITFDIVGGDDRLLFDIDYTSGALTFVDAPDYENPVDNNTNNDYEVEVQVSEVLGPEVLGDQENQVITITVTDVDEDAPVFTTPASVSVPENAATIHTVMVIDTSEVTFSISGGTDNALFDIDATSGVLTFINTPDFESPGDADTNNEYLVEVLALDELGNSANQTITIAVTMMDEDAPVFTSTSIVSVPENTSIVHTVSATDVYEITFSISGGTDNALFEIDAISGALSFINAADFETPGDVNTDNDYLVEIQATDLAGNTAIQTITVAVTDVDEDNPVFNSPTSVSIAENTAAVQTVTATDANAITYSISGGTDNTLFDIDATSGALTFITASDFETPGDSDTNNDYLVEIQATDLAGNTAIQTITVTVTDVDEDNPVFTSSTSVSIAENTAAVQTVTATDANAITYSISGGTDNTLFAIDATSGALNFIAATDFENPDDVDANNVYLVEIQATDLIGNTAIQTISITITDVDEDDPVFTSSTNVSLAENTTAVQIVTAMDVNAITYSISGGTDNVLFEINETSGVLSFIAAPDFETPSDANTDNEYLVEVQVVDLVGNSSNQTITVTVTDVDEDAPVFTSPASVSITEHTEDVLRVTAIDEGMITYSILDQGDHTHFRLTTTGGALRFFPALPDFENPLDEDVDNDYLITIQAEDEGGLTSLHPMVITVLNDDGIPPMFTSPASIVVVENTSLVQIVTAVDDTEITYSILSEDDYSLFEIDRLDGDLRFIDFPDYENPGDVDTDNIYLITIEARNGEGQASLQSVTITVVNDENAPSITSASNINVSENTQEVFTTLTASGVGVVTFKLRGDDANWFEFDEMTGELKFIDEPNEIAGFPNYEDPQDENGDNVYELLAIALDESGESDSRRMTITVLDIDESPVFTSPDQVSVPENTTAVQTVTADGFGMIQYQVVGGSDQSLFDIFDSTGELIFRNAPDFESPGDENGDNVYEVIVKATSFDGYGERTLETIVITVTDVDEDDPVFTSNTAVSISENTTVVQTVTATDASVITYSIFGGADDFLFTIDEISGALSFMSAPDFEIPFDADQNNVYVVDVIAIDALGNASTQNMVITVTDVEEDAPVFTSPSIASILENSTAVMTVTATDANAITFSISGGEDNALFDMDATSGALSFIAAPDFENPGDVDTDNEYLVEVQATDLAGNTAIQTITVAVTDVDEDDPIFTSSTSVSLAENTTAVQMVTATDANVITFSISGGADDALFDIDATSGALSFIAAPDFENPDDSNANNDYLVEIQATDLAGNTAIQTITVAVTDVDEDDPIFTSPTSVSLAENTTAIQTVTATDANAIIYSISGGDDIALFAIDATSGALTFIAAPDFENPGDADTNNDYLVEIQATDLAGNTAIQTITVAVTDVDEDDPIFTSSTSVSLAENTTAVQTVTASDANTLTYSISGGTDNALFEIDVISGALSFIAAPDFENPGDADTNNEYLVEVEATDLAGNTAIQTITVAVTDVDEDDPIFTSSTSVSLAENTTAVQTVAATDANAITYTIPEEADGLLFDIEETSGVLTFINAPDFEMPTDTDFNNVYVTTVIATDALGNAASQLLNITVTNANEAPVLDPIGSETGIEGVEITFTATASDQDGDDLTFSLDAASLGKAMTIDAISGVYSWIATIDQIGDHEVTVTVTDNGMGSLTDEETITISVNAGVNIWNGSVWSRGSAPDNTEDVRLEADYVFSTQGSFAAKDLEVVAGVTLIVDNENTLEVQGDLLNDGTNVIIESGSSLLTYGDITGENFRIDRITTFDTNTGRYSIVGSPVHNSGFDVLGSNALVYGYDETAAFNTTGNAGLDRFKTPTQLSQTVMEKGTGYFSAFSGDESGLISFTGTPNTGTINIPLSYTDQGDAAETAYQGFNLISNPYPSAIDFSSLMTENITADIDGSVYFWDDNSSNTGRGNDQDYLIVNAMGNTDSRSNGEAKWDGAIRSGQGFFIKANSATSLNFTNTMRGGNNSDAGFFRKTNIITSFKLLLGDRAVQRATVIGFANDATAGKDKAYDAQSLSGGDIQLYSLQADNLDKLGIQGLPHDYQNDIKLGFNAAVGTYTISLADFDLSASQRLILLKDHKRGTVIDLAQEAYTFNIEAGKAGENKDRFSIQLSNTITANIKKQFLSNIYSYTTSDHLYVVFKSGNFEEARIRLMDLQGRVLINEQTRIVDNRWETQLADLPSNLYLLFIETELGVWIDRVIVK